MTFLHQKVTQPQQQHHHSVSSMTTLHQFATLFTLGQKLTFSEYHTRKVLK